MGMLNNHDIAWMENTVREIIGEWDTTINIYSKLPLNEQPNYNHLMHEFTGDSYCTILIIQAERKDIVNNMTNDPDSDNLDFGKKNLGTFLYAIPDVLDGKQYIPSLHDLVTIGDGEVYYIRNIRNRIGETLITVKRFTGHKPKITPTTDNNVIIGNYDWSGEDG